MVSGSACPTKFRLHVAGFGVQGSSASSIQHLASRIRSEDQLRSQLIPNYFSLLAVRDQAPCCAGADTVVDTCAMLEGIIAASRPNCRTAKMALTARTV